MPSIKCPSCEHRILHSATLRFCTNCGASLATERPETEPVEETRQELLATPVSDDDLPPELLEPSSPSSPQARMEHRALVRHAQTLPERPPMGRRGLGPFSETAPLSPYQVPSTREIASFDPYPLLPATQVTEIQEPVGWHPRLTYKLPRGFPRRPPDIAGTLIYVQSQQEQLRTFDAAGSIVRLFADMVWSVPGDAPRREMDQIVVTTLRVRTSDGEQKDARLRGYLTGANLTLGDTISLWGRRRKGALYARRGYNHTSKSVIVTQTTGSSVFTLILLVVIIAGIYLLFSHYHTLLPLWPG